MLLKNKKTVLLNHDNNNLCTGCAHNYADHYTTNDGKKEGCNHTNQYYGDDNLRRRLCFCLGFSIRMIHIPDYVLDVL